MDLLVLLKLYLALSSLCSAVTLASVFMRFLHKFFRRQQPRPHKKLLHPIREEEEDAE